MHKYHLLFCILLTWRSTSSLFCTNCQCNNETQLKSMSVNHKDVLHMGIVKCNVNVKDCFVAYMKENGYVYRGCGSCAKFLRMFGVDEVPEAAVCTECKRDNCNNQVYLPKIFKCYTCERDDCDNDIMGSMIGNCSRVDNGCSVYNLTNRQTVRACGLCADIAKVSYHKLINCKDCTLDVCNNMGLHKAKTLRKEEVADGSSSRGAWGCLVYVLGLVLLALHGYLEEFV